MDELANQSIVNCPRTLKQLQAGSPSVWQLGRATRRRCDSSPPRYDGTPLPGSRLPAHIRPTPSSTWSDCEWRADDERHHLYVALYLWTFISRFGTVLISVKTAKSQRIATKTISRNRFAPSVWLAINSWKCASSADWQAKFFAFIACSETREKQLQAVWGEREHPFSSFRKSRPCPSLHVQFRQWTKNHDHPRLCLEAKPKSDDVPLAQILTKIKSESHAAILSYDMVPFWPGMSRHPKKSFESQEKIQNALPIASLIMLLRAVNVRWTWATLRRRVRATSHIELYLNEHKPYTKSRRSNKVRDHLSARVVRYKTQITSLFAYYSQKTNFKKISCAKEMKHNPINLSHWWLCTI